MASASERGRLLVVLGATATGKSALALALAQAVGGEIVSADASCVYRGLDVGTAKPSEADRALVPHHLLDCCEPDEDFSAARFVELAERAIVDIHQRGRVALVVGGTGMYLRALLRGLVASPQPDPELRGRLEARERARPGALHRLLRRLDPAAAARVDTADTFRSVRAVEHAWLTGRPLSAARTQWSAGDAWPAQKIGLWLPRRDREALIRRRVDAMLATGLIDEVRALLAQGVPPSARALRALGYREAVEHLAGRLGMDELRERMAVATRQYAKRQDTWFRREPDVAWHATPRHASELSTLVARVMMARGPSAGANDTTT